MSEPEVTLGFDADLATPEAQKALSAETRARIDAVRALAARVGGMVTTMAAQSARVRSAIASQVGPAQRAAAAAVEQRRAAGANAVQNADRVHRTQAEQSSATLVAQSNGLWNHAAGWLPGAPAPDSFRMCEPFTVKPLLWLGHHVLRGSTLEGGPENAVLDAFVPFMDTGSLVVEAPPTHPLLSGILRSIVGRAYLSVPPGQLQVSLFNPEIRGHLDAFKGGTGNDQASIFRSAGANLQGPLDEIASLFDHQERVSDSARGQHRSLGELTAATRQPEHPFRMMVMLDAPATLSRDAADRLAVLIKNGASRGVNFVIHLDPTRIDEREHGRFVEALAYVPRLRAVQDGWELATENRSAKVLVGVAGRNDGSGQPDPVQTLMAEIRSGAKAAKGTDVDLASVISPTLEQRSSVDGLLLRLGMQGQAVTELTLGSTQGSPLINALIGGAVGTGKTNLLKTIVYSLASTYAPDELEMYLLDFKQGVEFRSFIKNGQALPHARVISVESDPAFGIAALDHFLAERDRRAEVFKAAGVADLPTFRRTTGQSMPRWLLLIDEFQAMFSGDYSGPASDKLDELVRQGRSYGLHVILASQTLSGIRFERDKEASIMGQIAVRVVLKMDARDSQAFLETGNKGAAALEYRGQAVLNTDRGRIERNEVFVVAHAKDETPSDTVPRLHEELVRVYGSGAPLVYEGRETKPLAELVALNGMPSADDDGANIWLGQRSTVRGDMLALPWRGTGADSVAVIGEDRPTAIATVQLAVLSALATLPAARVVVVEGLARRDADRARLVEWIDTMSAMGATVERYGPGDDLREVRLDSPSADGVTSLVVPLETADTGFARYLQDLDLDRNLRTLPRRGWHVIGYWPDLKEVPFRSPQRETEFGAVVLAGASAEALEVIGNVRRGQSQPDSGSRLRVRVASGREMGVHQLVPVSPLTSEELTAWAHAARQASRNEERR